MLKSLSIRNIALIRALNIEFDRNLIVLSGETGAGKSLIIDSLNFILGAKSDKTLITFGEQSARVEALFEVGGSTRRELAELGYESEDGQLLLTRTLTADGRNDCRVNGNLATLAMLKAVSALLADIHGQHEHQSVLKVSNHIKLLDEFGGREILDGKAETAKYAAEIAETEKALAEIGGSRDERARTMDILQYQIDEIDKARLSEEEETTLIKKREKAIHAERLMSVIGETLGLLDAQSDLGELNAVSAVARSSQLLNGIARYDEKFSGFSDRLKSAYLEIDDIVTELRRYVDEETLDEKDVDVVEKRLDVYKELKRKYGATLNDVEMFCIRAKEQLNQLENSETLILELTAKQEKLLAKYLEKAQELSVLRRAAADVLEREIAHELHDLGMAHAKFSVKIDAPKDGAKIGHSPAGIDSVEFFLSPNKGEPEKPLSKIISGGEMSRFMLSLKAITAKLDQIDTMVFDEIDTGISGKIGEVVAQKLARISRHHQVLCISHLASIAAMADQHLNIFKRVEGEHTVTHVNTLDREGMVREISRLVGGSEISAHSLAHSEELKQWCDRFKESI